MKTAEKIIAALVLTSVVLKLIDDITWAGVATVISLSLLSLFYLVGTYFLFKQRENWDSAANTKGLTLHCVLGGIVLFMTINGLLFSVMHWPGSVNLLAVSTVGCLILAFSSFGSYRQSKRAAFLHLSSRLFIFGCAGILALLVSIL